MFLKRASGKGSVGELLGDGANPAVQEQAIAALGGRVTTRRPSRGRFDFVLVAELPDHQAVGYVCIQCCARGVHTTALRAYTVDEANGVLELMGARSAVSS